MKAAIFYGPGRGVGVEDVADPSPRPDEVLVKVRRCGICASDVSMTEGPFYYAPGHIGHEFAGEIIDVGRDLPRVLVGQRAACLWGVPCGQCVGCRGGRRFACTSPKIKPGSYGGFAEYAAIPFEAIVPLPQSLSLADGALIEPMACGLHGLRMAGIRGGERILVLGGGAVALSVVFWARRLGAASIVVASRSAHRQETLQAFGADAFHLFDPDDLAGLAGAVGGPIDLVAECVGKPGALGWGIDLVREGGTVMSLGMCTHTEPFMAATCAFKEVRLLFPLAWTLEEFEATAKAFDKYDFHPDLMVSDIIGLSELPATLAALKAGTKRSLKIHVDLELGT